MKLSNTAFKNDIREYCETYPHHVAGAGQFGTKGFAILIVSGESDAKILSDMEDHFEVSISELLDEINIYIEQTW